MKKISVMVFVIAILAIAVGSTLLLKNRNMKEETEEEKIVYNNFKISEELQIDVCKDKNNCPTLAEKKFEILSFDYNNDKLQAVINEINKKTKEEYEAMLASNLLDASCASLSSVLNHSLVYNDDIGLYEDENYVSIAVQHFKTNLCTEEVVEEVPQVYIFSKKDNEFISQKQFREQLGINNEFLIDAIKKNVKKENKEMKYNYAIENALDTEIDKLNLFYNSSGDLLVYYLQKEDNSYHVAEVVNNG